MNHKPLIALSAAAGFAAIALFAPVPAAQAQDGKVDFEKQILPIIKDRCIECHQKEYKDPKTGRLKKPKGKFRMDNPQLMLKGGDSEEDLIPGMPEKSGVYTSTTLPEDDDAAMPPKGDRLTKEQQELLKKWIAEGADFGAWKGAAE